MVGARSGAIPEVLDDERTGLLFDGDDPREVAQTILDGFALSADRDRRRLPRAGRRVHDRATAETHVALYRELLARG